MRHLAGRQPIQELLRHRRVKGSVSLSRTESASHLSGQKYKPDTILIEESGLGRTLLRDLKSAWLPVVGVIPEGDKLTRVSVELEKFANGQVFFPKKAPWLLVLENEVFAFPNGRNDDLVDALFQALAYKRPISPFDDAVLRGWDRSTTALLLQKLRGF